MGRVGHGLLRRRREAPRLDAVRALRALPARRRAAGGAALAGGRARHLRLRRRLGDAVGDAVALPGGDRRREGPRGEGARGVRVPLPRGRDRVRAVPRPPDGLPVRLPRRLRVPHGARARARRARPPRARRARPGARGDAPAGVPGAEGGAPRRPRCPSGRDRPRSSISSATRSAGSLVEVRCRAASLRREGAVKLEASSGPRRSTRMVADANAARRERLPERRDAQRVLRRRDRRVAAGRPSAADPRPLGAEGGRDGPAPGRLRAAGDLPLAGGHARSSPPSSSRTSSTARTTRSTAAT